MSTTVMLVPATVGDFLNGLFLATVIVVSVRAVVMRHLRHSRSQLTGVGVMCAASNYRVKRDSDCRQDSDYAVKHMLLNGDSCERNHSIDIGYFEIGQQRFIAPKSQCNTV